MSKFIMAIWLPGCGKTTYYNNKLKDDYVHLSSDKLREEMFGDVNDQEHNTEVFDEMLRRTKKHLKEWDNVYYDATNISAKRREHLLKQIERLVWEKECLFFAIPIEVVKERNKNRDRVVPEYVIDRMFKCIEIPAKEEGRDTIRIIRTEEWEWLVLNIMRKLMDMWHDNPHHTLTIWNHMYKAYFACKENETYKWKNIYDAVLFHDIWKYYTKVFKDSKWNDTEEAHYYWHENVWAYLYLCDRLEWDEELELYNAILILHHMDYFKWEWYINKIAKKYWEEFMESLQLLHECDTKAH